VVPEKVEPYLDGYKVTLQFGNVTEATLSGATVKIGWGPNGFGQTKEFQVPTSFLPGRYTRYEFALTPAKPADVKSIHVGISFTQLALGVPIDQ
jgi:hypothetical protein